MAAPGSMVRFALWILPFALVCLLYIEGRHIDPAYVEPPGADAGLSAVPFPLEAAGWSFGSLESYPRDRIYEKINGRLQYYEQYDVEHLYAGTWSKENRSWDLYAYVFPDEVSARGALSGERPPEAEPLDGIYGYRVPGMVAAAGGTLYVQLIASSPQADAEEVLPLLPILTGMPDDAEPAGRSPLTPAELAGDLAVPDSESLLPENAFGHTSLQQVQTVRVVLDDQEAIWFLARGGRAELEHFAGELETYGADSRFELDGARGGDMYGEWAIAGILENGLWGIAQASSRDGLIQHWQQLKTRMSEHD